MLTTRTSVLPQPLVCRSFHWTRSFAREATLVELHCSNMVTKTGLAILSIIPTRTEDTNRRMDTELIAVSNKHIFMFTSTRSVLVMLPRSSRQLKHVIHQHYRVVIYVWQCIKPCSNSITTQ